VRSRLTTLGFGARRPPVQNPVYSNFSGGFFLEVTHRDDSKDAP
jgi:hypothetical protein